MPMRKDAGRFVLLSLPFLALIALPYLAAARAGGEAYVFAGLLQNPIDGNSYLAKMYQGWRGDWTFTLPYTADPGEGTYLFLFYLSLGHLARLSGLSIVLVFHLARLASAIFLLAMMWRFFGAVLPGPKDRRLAFAMAAYGSGLGWLAALAGRFTADFWVAEAYPFLAAYANPHFPLGLGLVLALVSPASEVLGGARRWNLFWTWLAGLALAIILPFGLVLAGTVLAGLFLWKAWMRASASSPATTTSPEHHGLLWMRFRLRDLLRLLSLETFWRLLSLLAGGLPVLIYELWVAHHHPALAIWNAQNLTPVPPAWDFFLSFSPVLWFAAAGAFVALRSRDNRLQAMIVWAGAGLLLVYLPTGLQRRFILGLYVPLAGLAAIGIQRLASGNRRLAGILGCAFFILALPTNLGILLAAGQGVSSHSPALFLARAEHQAMTWLKENTPEGALILASADTGLLIPAQTGRRVFAGHPFETVAAVRRSEEVEAIFRGSPGSSSLPLLSEVDYIFIGPRERSLGGYLPAGDWQAVYDHGGVTVWAPDP
jgi:hypothetical protein